VKYIAFPNGGGTYFEADVFPLKRHPCTDGSKRYSPFNRQGTPKLRNRRTDLDRGGWLPFFIKKIEHFTFGTIIHGAALDFPSDLHFGFADLVEPDRRLLSIFRVKPGREPRVELNYFPEGKTEPILSRGFENCATEIELLAKLPKPNAV
jgi:hypothetical protein